MRHPANLYANHIKVLYTTNEMVIQYIRRYIPEAAQFPRDSRSHVADPWILSHGANRPTYIYREYVYAKANVLSGLRCIL